MKYSFQLLLFFVISIGLSNGLDAAEKKPSKKAMKSVKKVAEKEQAYLQIPFTLDGNIIPKNFLGHDLRAVYKKLEERKDRKKGEFETTAQYNSRIELEDKSPLFGSVKIGDKLSLVANVGSSYDADNSKLRVDIPSVDSWRTKYAFGITGQEIYNIRKNYIASNSYGATVEVSEHLQANAILVVNNIQKFNVDSGYSKQLEFVLDNFPNEKARKLKNQLMAICVFTLTDPFLGDDGYYLKATMDSPIEAVTSNKLVYGNLEEVILYNDETGEVLTRVRPNPS
ncbi:hypothetical protein [Geotalea sp. SG265]|uniref:hypothetical protein n=1 Tax=Geotalea sp. SG265 TaxID=2922867 RepID=UPI001FAF003B|nr:hypothetical protein [Geotalea sp. SG265]